MCSIVAVYINELKLIVFMIYRPPPNYKSIYHGEVLEKSFNSIVIKNIDNIMQEYKSPMPDIILAGDFNFPDANWKYGIGEVQGETKYIKNSLQQLIDLASNLNLLQTVTFGTRDTRSGKSNTLELIFTNNHELISNIYSEHSQLSDHRWIVCETSHCVTLYNQKSDESNKTNLASYNYLKTDWVTLKSKLKEINWTKTLEKYETSEGKIQAILEIIGNIVEEVCTKFKQQRGATVKIIPKDRRILLRNKKKLRAKLKKQKISVEKKDRIEKSIRDIDRRLLDSHQDERINEEI